MTTQSQQPDPREEDARRAREVDDALSAMRDEAEREAMREPIEPPVWRYWAQHGALELWALVALSMNLQPAVIKRLVWFGPEPSGGDRRHPMVLVNTREIVEGTKDFVTEKRPKREERTVDHRIERLPRLRESHAFVQRLAVAVSWLNLDEGLPTVVSQHQAEAPERSLIAPGVFVAWARHHLPVHEGMIATFVSAADGADDGVKHERGDEALRTHSNVPAPTADEPTPVSGAQASGSQTPLEVPADVKALWKHILYAHIDIWTSNGEGKLSPADAIKLLVQKDSTNLSEEKPDNPGTMAPKEAAFWWRSKPGAPWKGIALASVANGISAAKAFALDHRNRSGG